MKVQKIEKKTKPSSFKSLFLNQYVITEVLSFLDGMKQTLNPYGKCNGQQQFSKLESVIAYTLIATWSLITVGQSFGYAEANVYLNSTIALILGFLFGKNKTK